MSSVNKLILTYATRNLLNEHPFRYFWKSAVAKTEADIVVMSHDIPKDTVLGGASKDRVSFAEVDPKEIVHLMRDRHLAYWKYLTMQAPRYDYVMLSDSRDVVFQADPFHWMSIWESCRFPHPNDDFVLLVSEGFPASVSGFACIENFEFQRDIPMPFLQDISMNDVLNGGTILGTFDGIRNFLMLMWSVSMKTIGRCTDQATLNWLWSYLMHDGTYNVVRPDQENLCLTGEGMKESAKLRSCVKIENGCVYHKNGEKFAILHQWDRVPELKECVLSQSY